MGGLLSVFSIGEKRMDSVDDHLFRSTASPSTEQHGLYRQSQSYWQQQSQPDRLPHTTTMHPRRPPVSNPVSSSSNMVVSPEVPTVSEVPYASNWTTNLLRSRISSLSAPQAEILVELFEEEKYTLPYVARYCQGKTGNVPTATIRKTEEVLHEAKEIKQRALEIQIKLGRRVTPGLQLRLADAMSIGDLERIYSPFKSDSERSLADRARALNLETPAMRILKGDDIDLRRLVNLQTKGLETIEKIHNGVDDIIGAHVLRKVQLANEGLIKQLVADTHITVTATRKEAAKEAMGADFNFNKAFDNDHLHFCTCYDRRSFPRAKVEPHQMLNVKRLQKEGKVTLKFVIDEMTALRILSEACQMHGGVWNISGETLSRCYKRWYKTLVFPQMNEEIWSILNSQMQSSSVYWFVKGVRDLLLAQPIQNCHIVGIDPGFGNGVKVALIDSTGKPLKTGTKLPECFAFIRKARHVLYPFKRSSDSQKRLFFGQCMAKVLLEEMANIVRKAGKNRLRIGIGDGTACRETEKCIRSFIKLGDHGPFRQLNAEYRFVRECGSSPYSVSEAGEREFPDLNPLHISAVSIARRLQDPMAELVKCDPKHLGVGMYQHDQDKEILDRSLRSVTAECVSEVGVDLNTCSVDLLQQVAGLSSGQAAAIVKHRLRIGWFRSRHQLLTDQLIDKATYRQCAGFVHIYPATRQGVHDYGYNPLDATQVHPEQYELACRVLGKVGLTPEAITNGENSEMRKALDTLSDPQLKQTPNYAQVVDALQKPPRYDYRHDFFPDAPLFFNGARTIEELMGGAEISGTVNNVTDFGVFVDIGVGINGLIHQSALPQDIQLQDIKVGSKVVVIVLSTDHQKGSS